jgi:hypothetical protein
MTREERAGKLGSYAAAHAQLVNKLRMFRTRAGREAGSRPVERTRSSSTWPTRKPTGSSVGGQQSRSRAADRAVRSGPVAESSSTGAGLPRPSALPPPAEGDLRPARCRVGLVPDDHPPRAQRHDPR